MQIKQLRGLAAAIGLSLLSACATTPPPPPPPPVVSQNVAPKYTWANGFAPKAHDEAVAAFGPLALKPGDFLWTADVPKTGDAKVVVDLMSQLFYVYMGDRLVGVSTISSGKKGHETQLGFWSVLIKKQKGFSRKYDNAPMPFMQMYDAKGLAFHAGANPGYPASHGCVRLPYKFAERLFGMTRLGTKVVIEG